MSSFILGTGAYGQCFQEYSFWGVTPALCDNAPSSYAGATCCITTPAGSTDSSAYVYSTSWAEIPNDWQIFDGGTGYGGDTAYPCSSQYSFPVYNGNALFFINYGCEVTMTISGQLGQNVSPDYPGTSTPAYLLSYLTVNGMTGANVGTLSVAPPWYGTTGGFPSPTVYYPITEPAFDPLGFHYAILAVPVDSSPVFCCPEGYVAAEDERYCDKTSEPFGTIGAMYSTSLMSQSYYWQYTCDIPCGVWVSLQALNTSADVGLSGAYLNVNWTCSSSNHCSTHS
jgi:hypothetical protein